MKLLSKLKPAMKILATVTFWTVLCSAGGALAGAAWIFYFAPQPQARVASFQQVKAPPVDRSAERAAAACVSALDEVKGLRAELVKRNAVVKK